MGARKSMVLRVWDWLEGRYQVRSMMEGLLHVEIPRTARTYYFGGLTLFFFMVQAITGILLAIYYQPTPEAAYGSILFIMNQVNFGWLIRSIHAWSANLMIIYCVFHLLRVFFQAAYKPPRELTWVVGVLLLLLTLGFGFTGYLLPWDQRAYWATTVGSEAAGALPLVGEKLLVFLRGGTTVTARTLSRFFGTHVLVLPLAFAGVLLVHLVLLHVQGLADPTRKVGAETAPETDIGPTAKAGPQKRGGLLPFFPNYVLDEFIAWYVMLAVLIILVSLRPVGLAEPADPLVTPEHIKPEWYFLFVYQFFKVVPRVVGVLVPIIGGFLLLLLPFLDRNPHAEPRRRPFAIIAGVVTVIVIVAFSIWGLLS